MIALAMVLCAVASNETTAVPAPIETRAAQDAGVLAVRAAKLHLGDGRVVDDGVLLVEGGKILAIGAGVDVPRDAAVIVHDGHVTAGMVACHTYSGVAGEATDTTRAVLAEARLADAFDPRRSDFAEAARAGITTMVLSPRPDNLVGGLTAAVKTAGGRVLAPRAHLAMSLSAAAQQINRFPTSAAGAVGELEARLASGEGVFADAQAGRLPVLIHAVARHEIQRAAELARELGGTSVEDGDLFTTECDVFAPCAIGATLSRDTIPGLACKIVGGSANNQLAEAEDAARLHDRGILYAPDYIINAGGALSFALLEQGVTEDDELLRRMAGIGDTVTDILEEAVRDNETPVAVARRRVERVLNG